MEQFSDIISIPLDHISPNPNNPRKEAGDVTGLAASILEVGLLEPVVVRQDQMKGPDWYVLEAGLRRWTACRLAGLTTIDSRVRTPQSAEGAAKDLQLAFIENYHRLDLSAMEKARGLGRMLNELHLTQTEIAKRLGVTQATVGRYLTLLDLDKSSQGRVERGEITVDAAVAAVRRTRAADRKRKGHKPINIGWEPDWFGPSHALAKKARVMCDARGHNNRRRLNGVACGQCFETVIRNDQDVVRAAAQSVLEVPFIPSPTSLRAGLDIREAG